MRPSPERRRAWAEIDLAALARNYRALRARAGDRAVIAVVKADAYGHGARAVARTLEALGCEMLAVATLPEALELRACGVRAPLLLLNGPLAAEEADEAVAADVTCALVRLETLDWMEAAATRAGRAVAVQLELDTGMSRAGFAPEELDRALAKLARAARLRLDGLFTHLAEADDPRSEVTEAQRARFRARVERVRAAGFAPRWLHVDNSPGIVRGAQRESNAVRPGAWLYGVDPTLEGGHVLEPVMSVFARVTQVKTVGAGARVGYGGTWVASEPTKLLTLAIGYADGVLRSAAGRAHVHVAGQLAPLVGRISSDLVNAALPPGAKVEPGDAALLFGRDGDACLPVEAFARASGTNAYEALIRIGPRLPRLAS